MTVEVQNLVGQTSPVIEMYRIVMLDAFHRRHQYRHPQCRLAGGLTETDFIVAARINAISIKDLIPKPKARFWA